MGQLKKHKEVRTVVVIIVGLPMTAVTAAVVILRVVRQMRADIPHQMNRTTVVNLEALRAIAVGAVTVVIAVAPKRIGTAVMEETGVMVGTVETDVMATTRV